MELSEISGSGNYAWAALARIDSEKIAILKVPKEKDFDLARRKFIIEAKITAYMSAMSSNSIRMMGFTDRVGKPGGTSTPRLRESTVELPGSHIALIIHIPPRTVEIQDDPHRGGSRGVGNRRINEHTVEHQNAQPETFNFRVKS